VNTDYTAETQSAIPKPLSVDLSKKQISRASPDPKASEVYIHYKTKDKNITVEKFKFTYFVYYTSSFKISVPNELFSNTYNGKKI